MDANSTRQAQASTKAADNDETNSGSTTTQSRTLPRGFPTSPLKLVRSVRSIKPDSVTVDGSSTASHKWKGCSAIEARIAPYVPKRFPVVLTKCIKNITVRVCKPRCGLQVALGTSLIVTFVFIQSLMLNRKVYGAYHQSGSVNPLFGPSAHVLDCLGALNTNAIRQGEFGRLFWSMWMHAGWLHLISNLVTQVVMLIVFEPYWGLFRTMFCYFGGGLCGNLLSAILDPCTVTVGSSGALFGLIGGVFVYCFENWKNIYALWLFLGVFVTSVISFLCGFTRNIDNWAHLGGLIGGLLVSFVTISVGSATPYNERQSLRPVRSIRRNKMRKTLSDPDLKGGYSARNEYISSDPIDTKTDNCFILSNGYSDAKDESRIYEEAPSDISCRRRSPRRLDAVRVVAFLALCTYIAVTLVLLFIEYEFEPPGSVTFSGTSSCCCCYTGELHTVRNWGCWRCEAAFRSTTWADYCQSTGEIK